MTLNNAGMLAACRLAAGDVAGITALVCGLPGYVTSDIMGRPCPAVSAGEGPSGW